MTRALYDSIYNLLCIYIFTQIKYKPMFVFFSVTPLISTSEISITLLLSTLLLSSAYLIHVLLSP